MVSTRMGRNYPQGTYFCEGSSSHSHCYGHRQIGHADNSSTVAAINNHTSHHQATTHMLRCLTFLLAKWLCCLVAEHLPGIQNAIADALSCNNLLLSCFLLPHVASQPTRIPPALIQLLLVSGPDWTSPHWTDLWTSIWQMDQLLPPAKYMEQESISTQSYVESSSNHAVLLRSYYYVGTVHCVFSQE